MENVAINDNGTSKWSLVNDGEEWTADSFPLGSLVYYLPPPTVEDRSSHAARMKAGIFLGYEIL